MKFKGSVLGLAMMSPVLLVGNAAFADTLQPSATSAFSRAIPPEEAMTAQPFAPSVGMPVRSSSLVFRSQPAVRSVGTVPSVVAAPQFIRKALASPVRDSSLNAAVSRIEGGDLSLDGQATCVAQAVYYESRGEPIAGQKAVADVVINRTRRPGFASSPCGVVRQKGQFSNASRWRVPAASDPLWRRAKAVATLAVGGLWSISDSITHFHASRIKPGWNARRIASIGHHVFYGR